MLEFVLAQRRMLLGPVLLEEFKNNTKPVTSQVGDSRTEEESCVRV